MENNRHMLLSSIFKLSALLVCGISVQANPIDKDCPTVCESKECVRQANMIIKNMRPDVDPCQDFFSFACGGYKEKFGKNDTRSVYDDTWYSLQIQIKELIENLQPDEGSVSDKLKIVFENCMNLESSEMYSVKNALDFLSQVGIPDWPHLDEGFHFDKLSETLGKLAVYQEFAFISIKPTPYERENADFHRLSPAIILPGNFLLSSKMKPADVKNSVGRILQYFNIGKEEATNKWQSFKAIEDIGIQLQNVETPNHLGCKDMSRNRYSEVNCSKEMNGSMEFLCNLWKSAQRHGDLKKYYYADIIHISCQWNHFNYVENVFSNLVNISHRSLADYLSLRFFLSHLDDLNSYFHLTKKTYPGDKESAAKSPKPITRWEYCVGWIIKSMNLALGYEYTRKVMPASMQKNVLDIIEDYKQELGLSIEHLSWLDEKVKFYLKKQLERLDIGFENTMNRYRNETAIAHYYKEFQPVKGSFLKNILEYQKISAVTKDKTIFNSFYSSSDPYTMDFGLALLLPPTFSHGLPKIWNYATLGSIIGHELSHNFKYFFDFVHLDDETERHLNSKTQCYVHQYSQFIMEKTGKMMNSKEAEEEVVADNLGWALTEKIITKLFEDSDLVVLPSLEYTPQQITYISFAQDSCTVLSKEIEAKFYKSEPQNLQKLRVLGVLQNSRNFSKTFNCSKNSIMNPENKCVFFE